MEALLQEGGHNQSFREVAEVPVIFVDDILVKSTGPEQQQRPQPFQHLHHHLHQHVHHLNNLPSLDTNFRLSSFMAPAPLPAQMPPIPTTEVAHWCHDLQDERRRRPRVAATTGGGAGPARVRLSSQCSAMTIDGDFPKPPQVTLPGDEHCHTTRHHRHCHK